MAGKGDYIVRGDDGKFYKISRKKLHANRVTSRAEIAKHTKTYNAIKRKIRRGVSVPAACAFGIAADAPSSARSRD